MKAPIGINRRNQRREAAKIGPGENKLAGAYKKSAPKEKKEIIINQPRRNGIPKS